MNRIKRKSSFQLKILPDKNSYRFPSQTADAETKTIVSSQSIIMTTDISSSNSDLYLSVFKSALIENRQL